MMNELKEIVEGKKDDDVFYCDGQYLDHMLNVRTNCVKFTLDGVTHYFNYERPTSVRMDKLQSLADIERIAQLEEALKKAHEILLHEMDNGRTPTMLQGVGLGYFEDVIVGIQYGD